MKKVFIGELITLGFVVVLFSSPANLRAQQYPQRVTPPVANQATNTILSSFRSYGTVQDLSGIVVPTVVSVLVPMTERTDVAVVAMGPLTIEPSYVVQNTQVKPVSFTVGSTAATLHTIGNVTDKDLSTYADFPLPTVGEGTADMEISGTQAITSSSITLTLDANVAFPKTVELFTQNVGNGAMDFVIAKKMFTSTVMQFPLTTAQFWYLRLTYDQPLRIAELTMSQPNAERQTSREVRFLSQPGESYQIYFDADRSVNITTAEAGNLGYIKDVQPATLTTSPNPRYTRADIDGDGVPDAMDNCPNVANPGQEDVNHNGVGDLCEDFDRDGIINTKDNCPDKPNADQADADGDHIGDVCDPTDNRFTEQHKWIPWLGIGSAALVLVALFAVTARSTRNK